MIDWAQLYLFELITMRMTGFVMFNPIWGRNGVPGLVKAGFILLLSVATYSAGDAADPALPANLVGFALSFVIRLFLSLVQFGGEIVDTQMGLTMAQIYDASMQSNQTVTGSLLNILLILNFFAENGHYTLLRILVTSGEVLPYGAASFGQSVASLMAELFLSCIVLAVKLALPIMVAELLGEIGMGILMKAIPQINAFVINIELKVLIGMGLFFLFLNPINEFLLSTEVQMLASLRRVLETIGGG